MYRACITLVSASTVTQTMPTQYSLDSGTGIALGHAVRLHYWLQLLNKD